MPTDDRHCCDDAPNADRTGATTESDAGGGSGAPVDRAALDVDLPRDLRRSLEGFLGVESVTTLREWAREIRRGVGGSITRSDLCHADAETDHWGELDGERYYFACFYDAVVLAALADGPVDVRTRSPEGTVVRARAVGTDELRARPERAVFSLGVAADATAGTDGPTRAETYAAVCPYVQAFPTRAAYERWAASVDAATVGLPLDGATAFAEALTR
ncbi:organomercurial lyase [Halovivax limisalsi]|uniref:organomercurial lyase n=1 Tax=Halovivax limisalsi TaxID=1453760 RepID=UPI001FFDD7F6|nr:organomercurial lyase [Halovivax limisalsi]